MVITVGSKLPLDGTSRSIVTGFAENSDHSPPFLPFVMAPVGAPSFLSKAFRPLSPLFSSLEAGEAFSLPLAALDGLF